MNGFNQGDTVFTETGQIGEFIAATQDGFVVRPLLREDEETGEPFYGSPRHAPRVFAKAPIEVHEEKVAALLTEIAAKQEELRAIRAEIRTATAERQAVLAGLKQHEALKHIEDFIAGRLTHFTVVGWNLNVKVIDAPTFLKQDPDLSYSKDLKLLTLFGDTKGDLRWRINQYRDGSGSFTDHIYPFPSQDEATAKAREIIATYLATQDQEPSRGDSLNNLIASAERFGVPISAEITARQRAARLSGHSDRVAKLRKDLAEAEAALAAAEAAQ